MRYEESRQKKFLIEMSERQISATEFFSRTLLNSLKNNFNFKKVLIQYFDTENNFLSWTNWDGTLKGGEKHPYNSFINKDIVRKNIYEEAVQDRLTYFNIEPRLYRASDIIGEEEYDNSQYVNYLEKNFGMHYSVTMAFGINAYIQVTFFKCSNKENFTDEEMSALENLYFYIANAYKNFKIHEQSKILADIQTKIISSGEKAFLVADKTMRIMYYNKEALEYLEELFGSSIYEKIHNEMPADFLLFLLASDRSDNNDHESWERVIKGYHFKVYTYNQKYSNGIIDRYYWVTMGNRVEEIDEPPLSLEADLTPTELKVVSLLQNGLTYKSIAGKMYISYHTVKNHVQNVYDKLGVNSRYELIKLIDTKK